MTDPRADIRRLTAIGRQIAGGDRMMDLATAVELVQILDAIDHAVDDLEEELVARPLELGLPGPPSASACRQADLSSPPSVDHA